MSSEVSQVTRAYTKIRVMTAGAVCTLTLCNPARRNAIGPQMVNELLHALEDAHGDASIRVVVLTGEGQTFCAGGDFAELSGSAADGPELPRKGDYADLLLALARAEKPIVARVRGAAMGGGLGLVAASTFAVADSAAKLGTPEVHVGLFPMMIMAVLARLVPRRALLEMMLLGQKLTADQALGLGLVNRVVPPEILDETVAGIADELIRKSPITLALGLRAFAAQDGLDLEVALPLLREQLGACLATDDAREGLLAFLEKRPPVWTGR